MCAGQIWVQGREEHRAHLGWRREAAAAVAEQIESAQARARVPRAIAAMAVARKFRDGRGEFVDVGGRQQGWPGWYRREREFAKSIRPEQILGGHKMAEAAAATGLGSRRGSREGGRDSPRWRWRWRWRGGKAAHRPRLRLDSCRRLEQQRRRLRMVASGWGSCRGVGVTAEVGTQGERCSIPPSAKEAKI